MNLRLPQLFRSTQDDRNELEWYRKEIEYYIDLRKGSHYDSNEWKNYTSILEVMQAVVQRLVERLEREV